MGEGHGLDPIVRAIDALISELEERPEEHKERLEALQVLRGQFASTGETQASASARPSEDLTKRDVSP